MAKSKDSTREEMPEINLEGGRTLERHFLHIFRCRILVGGRPSSSIFWNFVRSIPRTTQQTQGADDHFADCPRLAFLVVVLARLQPTFEIQLLPADHELPR